MAFGVCMNCNCNRFALFVFFANNKPDPEGYQTKGNHKRDKFAKVKPEKSDRLHQEKQSKKYQKSAYDKCRFIHFFLTHSSLRVYLRNISPTVASGKYLEKQRQTLTTLLDIWLILFFILRNLLRIKMATI